MKYTLAPSVVLALIFGGPGQAAAEPWQATVTAFAAKNLQENLFYSHSRRDYVLAKKLAAIDHIALDEDVIFAAAYLHDMGAVSAFADKKMEHADQGAMKIDIVLAKTDFPKGKLDAVRAAIRTHNPDRNPLAPEARYLHDADILDNLGASGWAWALELVDKNGGKPTGPQMASNFTKTVALEKGVITPAGKLELTTRRAEQKAFYKALARETDDFRNL